MLSNLAVQMGVDVGILTLGIFCLFWILLGLGGAILAMSVNWPLKFGSHRSQEKDPALGDDEHHPPASPRIHEPKANADYHGNGRPTISH